MAQLRREAGRRLPTKPTAEQVAAWAELTVLLEAPATLATISSRLASFWEMMQRRWEDKDQWSGAQAEGELCVVDEASAQAASIAM